MKNLKTLLAIAFFSIFSISSYAQSADQVIDKYIKTIDPQDKLKDLKGVKMEITSKMGGMEMPLEMLQMKDGRMLIKINFQGKELVPQAFDGTDLWGVNFINMKAEKSTAENTENYKLTMLDFPDQFYKYKDRGYKIEYIGKETKEGTECHKIKLTKKPRKVDGVLTDDISFHYFDTENGLLLLSEAEIPSGPAKGQKSISKMSDYEEVEGIYYPHSMSMMGQEMKVKKVIINPVVEDKTFKFPTQ